MRGKYRQILVYIMTIMAFGVGIFFPKAIAFAGGINGNEAGVIAAASGTFTYEGKSYRVSTAYINSLTTYLSGDSVDLTAEQATKAINMLYSNIQTGVERGYMYEVNEENGGSDTTETTGNSTTETMEDNTEMSGEDTTELSSENLVEDASPDDVEVIEEEDEKQEQTKNEVDVWEAMSNPNEQKQQLEQRPEEEDASAAVEMEKEQIVVTTKDNEKINIEKSKPIISNAVLIGIDVCGGVMFVITCVCGVILFATKCMTFRKRKSKKARPGHSKRRKIRHWTRAVLTVTTAISIIAIMLFMGLYASLFDNDVTMQNMQSSGYFRYAYSEYISGIAEELGSKIAAGEVDMSDEEMIVSYEDYLYTIKNNSLKVLNGETNIPVPDSNVAPYVYNLKNSYSKAFPIAGVMFILSTVFGIILMIYMDLRRERGIKHTAASVLAAGVLMGIATLIMLVYKPYVHLYIEPDYLYLFLMACIKRCTMVMMSITAFGIALGMILCGVYRGYCNKKND